MSEKDAEGAGMPEEDDGIVRHYNRERRLSKASPEVRWMVRQYSAKRPGILGSLVATPSLRFIFFSVLLFLAAGGLLSYLSGRQDSGILGDQVFKATAFRFGDTLYVTLQRSARSEKAYTGIARMSAFLDAEPIASMDFFIGPGEKEDYRMTAAFPGSGGRLKIKVDVLKSGMELSVPVR